LQTKKAPTSGKESKDPVSKKRKAAEYNQDTPIKVAKVQDPVKQTTSKTPPTKNASSKSDGKKSDSKKSQHCKQ
jgi:hypothetical protein